MSKKSSKGDNSKRQQPVHQQRAQAAQARKPKVPRAEPQAKQAGDNASREEPPKH